MFSIKNFREGGRNGGKQPKKNHREDEGRGGVAKGVPWGQRRGG